MKVFTPTTLSKEKIIALLLSGSAFLTACSNAESNTALTTGDNDSNPTHNSAQKEQITKIESLEQVKPNYIFKRWAGEYYLTIDEESLSQIIQLAMRDAQKFYLGIGSYNMKLDENFNNIPGNENFYTDWMNTEFFMARAKQEASELFMVNYRAGLSSDINKDPCGIMQINPKSTKDTLMEYYRTIYKENIDLSHLQVFPSDEDVANVERSKQAQKNITQTVYNNIYLSICYDIYETKCLNPGHENYFKPYGGYNESIRHHAAIAAYYYSLDDIVESLIDGSFYDKYYPTVYVQNILKFQEEFKTKNIRQRYYNQQEK